MTSPSISYDVIRETLLRLTLVQEECRIKGGSPCIYTYTSLVPRASPYVVFMLRIRTTEPLSVCANICACYGNSMGKAWELEATHTVTNHVRGRRYMYVYSRNV